MRDPARQEQACRSFAQIGRIVGNGLVKSRTWSIAMISMMMPRIRSIDAIRGTTVFSERLVAPQIPGTVAYFPCLLRSIEARNFKALREPLSPTAGAGAKPYARVRLSPARYRQPDRRDVPKIAINEIAVHTSPSLRSRFHADFQVLRPPHFQRP